MGDTARKMFAKTEVCRVRVVGIDVRWMDAWIGKPKQRNEGEQK